MAWTRGVLVLALLLAGCDKRPRFECSLDEPRFCTPRWPEFKGDACKDCSNRDRAFCAWFDEMGVDARRRCFPTDQECSSYEGFKRKSDCVEVTVDALPNEWVREAAN